MDESLERKFEILVQGYTKKLPDKITEINEKWEKIKSQWDAELAEDLLIRIHGLKGSSRIYGFDKLSEIAGKIESTLTVLKNQTPTEVELKSLETLFAELTNIDVKSPNVDVVQKLSVPKFKPTEKQEKETTIFLYLRDTQETKVTINSLQPFGYQTKLFTSLFSFTKAISEQPPDFLVIDIEEVSDLTKDEIEELKKEYTKSIPIIFLSRSSAIQFRLQAVKLNGLAFITKPFLVSELVDAMNSIIDSQQHVYRVLIVDDEPEVGIYYSTLLNGAGMKTASITSINEIDKILHEFIPELIISDFHLPECNGLELAAVVRQQKLYETIPFIFLSSESSVDIHLQALSLGADDFIIKGTKPEHIILTIKNKAERYRKLQNLLTNDNLTGVFNHSSIIKKLNIEIEKANEQQTNLYLAMIDIDHLSSINQEYGHSAGDQIIKALASLLLNKLRRDDIIGRFSDKSFLIILPNTNGEEARTLFEAIKTQFAALSFWWDYRLFSASCRVCLSSPQDKNASQVINTLQDCVNQGEYNSIIEI